MSEKELKDSQQKGLQNGKEKIESQKFEKEIGFSCRTELKRKSIKHITSHKFLKINWIINMWHTQKLFLSNFFLPIFSYDCKLQMISIWYSFSENTWSFAWQWKLVFLSRRSSKGDSQSSPSGLVTYTVEEKWGMQKKEKMKHT